MQPIALEHAEGTEVDEAADAGRLRRGDEVRRAAGVDALEVCAAVPIARQRDEVDDRVAAVDGAAERGGIDDIAEAHLQCAGGGGVADPQPLRGLLVTHERHDLVSGGEECGEDVAADEARAAGEEDARHGPSLHGAERPALVPV